MKIKDFTTILRFFTIKYDEDHQYRFKFPIIIGKKLSNLEIPNSFVNKIEGINEHDITISYNELSKFISPKKIEEVIELDKKCAEETRDLKLIDIKFFLYNMPFMMFYITSLIIFFFTHKLNDPMNIKVDIVFIVLGFVYLIVFCVVDSIFVDKINDKVAAIIDTAEI